MSPYGWSKLMTEQMLRDAYVAHGMNTVNLRYFNVAGADPLCHDGPDQPERHAPCHEAVRAPWSCIGKLTVYGDGNDARDYVHVADVAEANLRALEWTARHNGCLTLNVGRGQSICSVVDVVDTVSRAIAQAGSPCPRPRNAARVTPCRSWPTRA
jgi:UDP-glucose 4-epimerase